MTDFAYVTLTLSEDAPVRIVMNGFPLLAAERPARMQWMEILNMLMLRDNLLSLEVMAPEGVAVTATLRLARHAPGTVVAPNTGMPLPAQMRAATGTAIPQGADGSFVLSGTGPLRAELRFATFGPDFSDRLQPDSAVTPEQALRVARGALQGLEQGNLDAVLYLMEPRIQDSARVWQDPVSQVRAAIREGLTMLTQGLPEGGLDYALSTQQLGPLVRVMRDGGALFQSMDRSMRMEATFGLVDGQVMILR